MSSPSPIFDADVVVTPNPTSPREFKSIADALKAAPLSAARFGIHVTAGTYKSDEGPVIISRSNVTLSGEGIGITILTGSRNLHDSPGLSTSGTATLIVEGEGFIGANMTVRNTSGPEKDQAVAMRASADRVAFYKCSFEGYQDTLYPDSGNQFYRECDIYGTIDFIFSQTGRSVFQDCNIYVRDPRPKTTNTITADGREVPDDANGGGICIHRGNVWATPELLQAMAAAKAAGQPSIETYLGRPWKKYSRTVFMNTYMDGFLNPAGWAEWPGPPDGRYEVLYYAEYHNRGPGAATDKRVGWKGYHVIENDDHGEASRFTVAQFIDGNSWLPATRIPFSPGLDEPAGPPSAAI